MWIFVNCPSALRTRICSQQFCSKMTSAASILWLLVKLCLDTVGLLVDLGEPIFTDDYEKFQFTRVRLLRDVTLRNVTSHSGRLVMSQVIIRHNGYRMMVCVTDRQIVYDYDVTETIVTATLAQGQDPGRWGHHRDICRSYSHWMIRTR